MSATDATATVGSKTLQALCEEKRVRCLYTSTTFLTWLKSLRFIRTILIIAPIIFGAVASWSLLKGQSGLEVIAAIFALLAGVVPAVYSALKFDEFLPSAAQLAGEYKNLELSFGDLAKMCTYKPVNEVQSDYDRLLERLQRANSQSFTAPEWCYQRAKRKIEAGEHTKAILARAHKAAQ